MQHSFIYGSGSLQIHHSWRDFQPLSNIFWVYGASLLTTISVGEVVLCFQCKATGYPELLQKLLSFIILSATGLQLCCTFFDFFIWQELDSLQLHGLRQCKSFTAKKNSFKIMGWRHGYVQILRIYFSITTN